MANTSTHPITVNGVRLDTYAYNIETKAGWSGISAKRGSNAVVPGRHGELALMNKRHEPGSFILSMWVSDRDVDGNKVGTDPFYNWRENLDALVQIFDSSYALLDVRLKYGAGTYDTRQAFCENGGAWAPEMHGNLYGKFKVALEIPDVFWQDTATQDWASPTSAAAIAIHSVTTMAGATAPIEDAIYVVDGPITNPLISDPLTGHYVQYGGTIASGSQWVVDSSTWWSATGVGIEWTQGGTNATALTYVNGLHAPRFMALVPTQPVRVRLQGSATGTNTRLRIRSRRKYK